MKNYNIYPYQNDLNFNEKLIQEININILEKRKNNKIYKTILFKEINNELENIIIEEILFFLKKIIKKDSILIVGMGSEHFTADSIGPNVINHIKVNAYLENLGIKLKKTKISTLKPGVLGETGILSEKTISSITKEIKPDLVIIIDSFVSDNIAYLNHSIEINNYGISPGIGIKGINSFINQKKLGVPILVIGITTSLLIKFENQKHAIPYLLSTKDIDEYILKISELMGNCLNKAIDSL